MNNVLALGTPAPFVNKSNFAPASISNIGSITNLIIPLLIGGAGIAFLGMLLYGAFIWITAGSEAKNIEKATKIIIYAIIGLLIVVFSYLGIKIIAKVLQIDNVFHL